MNSILLTFIFAVSLAGVIAALYLEVSWFAEYRRSSREYRRGYSLIQNAMTDALSDALDRKDQWFLKQVLDIYQTASDSYGTPNDSPYRAGIRKGYVDFYRNLKSEPKRILLPQPDFNCIYFLSDI